MSPVAYIIIAIVVLLVGIIVTALVTKKVAVDSYIKSEEQQLGSAQDRAKQIVDEALKNAETTKREALLEAKEEAIKTKNEIERESKERRAELQRYEERVLSKEESLDKKSGQLERKEAALNKKDASLDALKEELEHAKEENLHKLEEISGLTSEQAKEYLLKSVEEEVKHETAVLVKELDRKAKEEADKRAKDYVVNAIQRCAADHAAETTISVVQLPNDEMKGRIIGREGRNIRTLEQLTGVDLIIDDTPGISITELRSKCRKMKLEYGLSMVIIDYLQLMTGSGGKSSESRQQEISEISRSLKGLARELNVPVLALSQLSRAVEQRTDKRPMLSDLRESGAIEQDADVCMFIYRDDYYNHDSEMKGIWEISIAKQRNGAIGTVNLVWLPQYTKFANMEK